MGYFGVAVSKASLYDQSIDRGASMLHEDVELLYLISYL